MYHMQFWLPGVGLNLWSYTRLFSLNLDYKRCGCCAEFSLPLHFFFRLYQNFLDSVLSKKNSFKKELIRKDLTSDPKALEK